MHTWADKIIAFNKDLDYKGKLPKGIRLLNSCKENKDIQKVTTQFYKTFYSDCNRRKLILGINPGRLGAGATGIPFTDSKRLEKICGLYVPEIKTHEPSSVFVYDVIEQYGGVEKFYFDYYIHSVCPLGFVVKNDKGHWVNCNYYDFGIMSCVKNFIIEHIKKQLCFGVCEESVIVLGKENAKFFIELNRAHKFFKQIKTLPHPRYIMQYRFREKNAYIKAYVQVLSE